MDLHASDKDGKTALVLAAYHGSLDAVKMLLHYRGEETGRKKEAWEAPHGGAERIIERRGKTAVVELTW